MLNMLVGRGVTSKKGKPQFIRPTAKLTVASFKAFDSDDLVGAAIFDIGLSVYASAALSMIPASGVSAVIASGRLPDNIAENLAEVYNIACNLLATPDGDFSRLSTHYITAKEVPADLAQLIKGSKHKVHVGIDVEGYGGGLASFYVF